MKQACLSKHHTLGLHPKQHIALQTTYGQKDSSGRVGTCDLTKSVSSSILVANLLAASLFWANKSCSPCGKQRQFPAGIRWNAQDTEGARQGRKRHFQNDTVAGSRTAAVQALLHACS